MSRPRRSIYSVRDPIGLSLDEAAELVGVSASLFQRAVEHGLMPRPRKLFGRVLFDADEVISAYRLLPRHGDRAKGERSDDPWGDVAT